MILGLISGEVLLIRRDDEISSLKMHNMCLISHFLSLLLRRILCLELTDKDHKANPKGK